MRARKQRAQFSFEALLVFAAYFAFVALLVSAVSGEAKKGAVNDDGRQPCMALSVSSGRLQANLTELAASPNLSECNAAASGGGRLSVSEMDWR